MELVHGVALQELRNLESVAVTRPQDTLGKIDRSAVGGYVHQSRDPVGVQRAGGRPQRYRDRPGDLQHGRERRRGEAEDVLPGLNRALVIRPLRSQFREAARMPASAHRWRTRIVHVRVVWLFTWLFGRQRPVAGERVGEAV